MPQLFTQHSLWHMSSSRDSETLLYAPQEPCSIIRQGCGPGELPLGAGGECTAHVLPFCSAAEHKESLVESGIQRLWSQAVQKAAGLGYMPWFKARPNASVLNTAFRLDVPICTGLGLLGVPLCNTTIQSQGQSAVAAWTCFCPLSLWVLQNLKCAGKCTKCSHKNPDKTCSSNINPLLRCWKYSTWAHSGLNPTSRSNRSFGSGHVSLRQTTSLACFNEDFF